jgi:hypothetical protein
MFGSIRLQMSPQELGHFEWDLFTNFSVQTNICKIIHPVGWILMGILDFTNNGNTSSSVRGGVGLNNVDTDPPPDSSIINWQRINWYTLFLLKELMEHDLASPLTLSLKYSLWMFQPVSANHFRLHVVRWLFSLQTQLTLYQADS